MSEHLPFDGDPADDTAGLDPDEIAVPVPAGASRGRRGSGHRRTRRKAMIAVLIAVIVLGGFGGAAALGLDKVYDRLTEGTADFDGPPGAEQVVQITAGSSIRGIGRTLAENGVIQTEGSFVAAARKDSRAATLQPGFYRLKLTMPAMAALQLMLDPASRILARVVVPEGRTVNEILTKLSRDTNIEKAKFESALKNPELGLPAFAKGNPEGFLFPATYDVEPDDSALSILKDMVKRFDQALTETELLSRAPLVGLKPLEVLTVASLIQAEAKLAVDMPKIARVIYNRLEREMKLQFDTTVIYANGGEKSVTTTAEQRASDSPYNTYKFAGLPPGPITAPGVAAIEAALAPAVGDWIFFVAVNPDTGETKYGVNATEHARNVEEFRAWLRANPGR
ncbi:MAG: endolytic transglycosylase MltG [Sporichthyaceae bacterium]